MDEFNPAMMGKLKEEQPELGTFDVSMIGSLKNPEPEPKIPGTGLVKTWSFSGLQTFEKCPYETYLNKVLKLPSPSGPAAERGTQIHTMAEDWVQGELEERPKELDKFAEDFEELRELYQDGKVFIEGEWGFTNNWEVTGWMEPDTWLRMKLDVLIMESETSCRIIDHKTGKKWGNEVKHGQQGKLYGLGTAFKYPELEFFQTEFWYLDKGEKMTKTYSRDQIMLSHQQWHERATIMTSAQEHDFNPKPSKWNCQWCPYAKSGECDYATQ